MYIDVDKARFGTQTQWIAEAGVVDLFLMTGPTPSQAISPNTMRALVELRVATVQTAPSCDKLMLGPYALASSRLYRSMSPHALQYCFHCDS